MSLRSDSGFFFHRCRAFLRRDVLFETSYKLQSLFRFLRIVFTIVIIYFMSLMVGGENIERFPEIHAGDYFTYSLIGIAFVGFLHAGLLNYTTNIRQQMNIGVLEAMVAAPIRPISLLLYTLIWPMLWELIKAILYVLIGKLAFDANIEIVDLPLFAVTLVISIAVFGSLGIMAGSMIVYFKRGDPIAWLLSSVTMIAGGVLFPAGMLPDWLQAISRMIPFPYALRSFRASLVPDSPYADRWHDVFALLLFAALFMPAAGVAAWLFFAKARREGNLSTY